jgi:predicted  nucleic acid-binding Zn-ribbon protein
MATEIKTEKEITIEEKLFALYDLQKVVSKIDEIKILRGELPLEVQDLEDEIIGLSTRLEHFDAELKDIQANIASKKIEIEESRVKIDRYKEQQENVRNNREFDNLSKEIEFQTLEIELCDKRIREFTASKESKTLEQKITIDKLSERKLDLEQKKGELNEIIAETKQEEEKLREHAKEIELLIEPRLLTAFKRIRKNARNGLAVVYVQRDACGGCFNKIPAQRQLDIRLRKKIIVCEYCGRILVDQELAGVALPTE